MNKEFFEAVKALEKEKGIPAEYLYEKIQAAILVAVKKDYGGKDVISCEIDPEHDEMHVYLHKTVRTRRNTKRTPRSAMRSAFLWKQRISAALRRRPRST